MKLKTSLLAAAAVLAISPAAHAYKGLYGAIGAGLSYMQEERDVSNDGTSGGPFIFDSSADYDKGIGVYTALGYAWDNNWRTELELSYRTNDIDQIDPDGAGFSGFPAGTIAGDTKAYALMANAIYDIDLGSPITPYLGAGLGLAIVDHNIAGAATLSAPTPALSIAYGSSNYKTLAYQGIAGLGIALAEDLTLDLSYRFFGTRKGSATGTLNGAAAEFDTGYHVHSFFAGLRWSFGDAQAAPPPVQYKDCWDGSSVPLTSQCPPQLIEEAEVSLDPVNFTVYFDYDKSNLTDQAATLVREAASRALANDVDTVVVQGNTDTSGSSAYNQALSERRGRIVRDALIANGISADDIRVEAFGESNPAKPTPDGVREPLNRRSDVTISFE